MTGPDAGGDGAWSGRGELTDEIQVVLGAWSIVGASARPLVGGLSGDTWRIDADGMVFVLRRHDPRSDPPGHVRSALARLGALTSESGLRVPVPVARADGIAAPVVTPATDAGAGTRWTLVSWVAGETLGRLPDTGEARRIGAAVALLHRRAREWAPERPAWFDRPVYDGSYFRRMAVTLLARCGPDLSDPDRVIIDVATDRAATALDALAAVSGESGLIHADIHDGNVVFDGDDPVTPLGVVDFGRCGSGPWALDLAMAQHYLTGDLAEPLADAYRDGFPLSPGAVAALPALRFLAAVENLAVLSVHPGEADFIRAELPALVEQAGALPA